MKIIPFVAESAADAVAQIRSKLGPEAVVVNVRQLPPQGIARLWQKPQIEVLAYRPEPPEVASLIEPPPASYLSAAALTPVPATVPDTPSPAARPSFDLPGPNAFLRPVGVARPDAGWRVGVLLEDMGFLPLYAQQVVERLRHLHGDRPPDTVARELQLARALLAQLWRPSVAPPGVFPQTHVLIGASGTGKTTCLCKWLVQSVLLEGRTAQVWRLDGRAANTAEVLSVFCEMLGVAMCRSWPAGSIDLDTDFLFIDLPGAAWNDTGALDDLAGQLKGLPNPELHLVLNAAYEIPILLAQTNAFARLPLTDLIFTHLDEEQRWGKLWNFVLGTNFTIRLLSAGQNIPGDLHPASAELLLSRQFQSR